MEKKVREKQTTDSLEEKERKEGREGGRKREGGKEEKCNAKVMSF